MPNWGTTMQDPMNISLSLARLLYIMAVFQDIIFPLMIRDYHSSPFFQSKTTTKTSFFLWTKIPFSSWWEMKWTLKKKKTIHHTLWSLRHLFGFFIFDRWKKDESWETTKWVDRMTISLDIKAQFSENKTLENGKSYEVFEVCLDTPTVTSLKGSEP